jgi:hypothetical protein
VIDGALRIATPAIETLARVALFEARNGLGQALGQGSKEEIMAKAKKTSRGRKQDRARVAANRSVTLI